MSKTVRKLNGKLQLLLSGESGQDLVEYGMLVAMVALFFISSAQSTANSVNNLYGQISQAFDPQQSQQQQQSPPQQHHHHGGGGGGGGGWWHH